jgi:hypothetical protein
VHAPIERPWVALHEGNPDRNAHFTVYCLNVLTQKFATSDTYQYCPSWALTWDYRKELIIQDIMQQNADIVCLQARALPHPTPPPTAWVCADGAPFRATGGGDGAVFRLFSG